MGPEGPAPGVGCGGSDVCATQQRQCRQGYVEPIRMEALAMESTWGGWVHVGIQVERVATQHARSNEILKPSGLKPCERVVAVLDQTVIMILQSQVLQ